MVTENYKTYFYFRNGLLHIKHVVDECVKLSEDETTRLKEKLAHDPADKQDILSEEWFFQTEMLHKEKMEGKQATDKNIKRLKVIRGNKNG